MNVERNLKHAFYTFVDLQGVLLSTRRFTVYVGYVTDRLNFQKFSDVFLETDALRQIKPCNTMLNGSCSNETRSWRRQRVVDAHMAVNIYGEFFVEKIGLLVCRRGAYLSVHWNCDNSIFSLSQKQLQTGVF